MNNLQNLKFVNVTPPAAIVDNAAVTTGAVDVKGWSKACFVVQLGALDIAITAMKLRESDDNSSYSDISGADFSVSPLTLPSATDDNKLFAIFVDLRGRKRYLDLSLTCGDGAAGTFVSVMAILDGGAEHPNTATERGLSQQAIV
ncbi:MAG TPA: hypothetical protein VIL74_20645 [Pyrinomonadaceae bacterium]|jgi:hypothetical protein